MYIITVNKTFLEVQIWHMLASGLPRNFTGIGLTWFCQILPFKSFQLENCVGMRFQHPSFSNIFREDYYIKKAFKILAGHGLVGDVINMMCYMNVIAVIWMWLLLAAPYILGPPLFCKNTIWKWLRPDKMAVLSAALFSPTLRKSCSLASPKMPQLVHLPL